MKTLKLLLLIVPALALAAACVGKKEQKTLILYGSSDCDHCIVFKAKLDSAEIAYEFKDLKIEEKRYDIELLEKIKAANYKGYVHFPVADIEGKIIVKPELEEVMESLYE